MNESEMVASAGLDAYPDVAAAMTAAGGSWLGTDLVGQAARRAVAAWAMAVNGDDSTLLSIADSDAAHWLMHPVWKDWAIAPDPLVTKIELWQLDVHADPPELGVTWQFTGRRLAVADQDEAEAELVFVGNATLTFKESAVKSAGRTETWPWRLTSGNVSTLDEVLGWTFVSRFETPPEYQRRMGATASGMLVPTDTYLLDAAFADHDMKFGASAQAQVSSDPAPTRSEAEKLIWPAIWAQVRQSLGDGDWHPSLGSLQVIRLLGPASSAATQD